MSATSSELNIRLRTEAEARADLEAAAKAERDSGIEHGVHFNALVLDGAFERIYSQDGTWLGYRQNGKFYTPGLDPMGEPTDMERQP